MAVIFLEMVDPKGIEPSNLTDANRALSQLSYGPMAAQKLILRSTNAIITYYFYL